MRKVQRYGVESSRNSGKKKKRFQDATSWAERLPKKGGGGGAVGRGVDVLKI